MQIKHNLVQHPADGGYVETILVISPTVKTKVYSDVTGTPPISNLACLNAAYWLTALRWLHYKLVDLSSLKSCVQS